MSIAVAWSKPDRFYNVVANYAGVAVSLLVGLGLVPFYIARLGTEAYGLVGFFLMLLSVLQIADFGLGTALNRELSRRSVSDTGRPVGNLIRTVETCSVAIGCVLGASVALAAPVIADQWLNGGQLPHETVVAALRWMGLAIALQWPTSLYNGGLQGLEQQVKAVAIASGSNLVFAGGALVLLRAWPRLDVFFQWRAAVSLATVVVQRYTLVRSFREPTESGRFDFGWIRDLWRFSLGMMGVSLTGVLLVQLDKLAVSKWLSLQEMGIYMVASTAANAVPTVVSPIFSVALPALNRSVASADTEELKRRFHLACGLVGALVFPIALGVAFFAQQLLVFWTRDVELAQRCAPVLSILSVGALLNATMVPLYAVQVAAGWTRLAIGTNVVMILTVLPYGQFAIGRWGPQGAASMWVFLNSVYVLLGTSLTFRRLLPGAFPRWLLWDVLLPLGQSSLVLMMVLQVQGPHGDSLGGIVGGIGGILLAAAFNTLGHPDLRKTIRRRFLRGTTSGATSTAAKS